MKNEQLEILKESLLVLKDKKVIDEDTHEFLDEARLLRIEYLIDIKSHQENS